MTILLLGLSGLMSRVTAVTLAPPHATGQGYPGPALASLVAQGLAVAVVVAAALLIARLHRKVLSQCQELQNQMVRAEEAQVKLQALLADLVATLNLSLASCARQAAELDMGHIESIRAAVQNAIEAATAAGGRAERL